MNNISGLQILVLLSALYAFAGLIFLWIRTFGFGKAVDLSATGGSKAKGILYAFGRGMMPWEKESAANHLPTFLGGIVYHCALLTALMFIFWDMFLPPVPLFVLMVLKTVWLIGLAAGITLFLKRSLSSSLKSLSCPDDFIANLFADAFLAVTLLSAFNPALKTTWYICTVLLFIYIPLGKIRHCFFFFVTRIIFGKFFGRRGVYPGERQEAEL